MNRIVILISAFVLVTISLNAQYAQNVNARSFSDLIKSNDGVILDVRTPGEYSRGHIEGSTLIDINDPKFIEKVNLLQKDKPLYIYCLTGSRSRVAANYLSQNGYTKVYNLTKGIVEWHQLGFAIVQSSMVAESSGKTYSDAEFKKVLSSSELVMVNFHAPWCTPCKKMAPTMREIANDFKGKAKVEKVDIEINKGIQTAYGVQSIPGLVLFKGGKEVWRHSGVLTYDEIALAINKYM